MHIPCTLAVFIPSATPAPDARCCRVVRPPQYLTKKFLKKHNVRDWLRVIASNKDRGVYELRYFNMWVQAGCNRRVDCAVLSLHAVGEQAQLHQHSVWGWHACRPAECACGPLKRLRLVAHCGTSVVLHSQSSLVLHH